MAPWTKKRLTPEKLIKPRPVSRPTVPTHWPDESERET
jgi:hypothetical protein